LAPSAEHWLLIDGNNALYRAFFAIPRLHAPDGTPTNAAYGFVTMLAKVLREEQPDRVLVAFDARGPNFRHRLFEGYKAGRDAQPEDLSAQLPLARELTLAHGIPILEVPGYEADDVIATLVARAGEHARVTIVSSDKDLMQLVSERVTLLDGMKERRYGPAEVEERFGVPPARMLDLRALVGDPSDNIPGVKGIGEKGAAALLAEWGDLESVLAHAGEVKAKRAREALAAHAEDARLSKQLSTLHTDAPLPESALAAGRPVPDRARLRALFERLGMSRLLAGVAEPAREELPLFDGLAPGGVAAAPDAAAAPARAVAAEAVRVVCEAEGLRELVQALAKQPCVCLVLVAGEGPPLAADPVGLAFALAGDAAAYVPLGAAGLAFEPVAALLEPLLGAGGSVAWAALDAKGVQLAFAERGVALAVPCFDLDLARQLLDPSGSSSIAALAHRHAGLRVRSFEELAGRGAKATPVAELAVEALAGWAGELARAVAALRPPLERQLDQDGLTRLYEEVELPLTRVLARMQRAGVRVDEAVLARLSREYASELARIEGEIHQLAGERFLVSSPKQLQQILFEKLKLPVMKKTKTGYSTDEDVLEQLAAHHELPARILAYRRLAKLKNTYVDALPPLVNPRTGRIHPTYNQLGAATGRLSATQPNVQNIPIRTAEGVRIREAFVPAEGSLLLSADYSQVELRILAHYSGDESLIDAFRRGEDIHRRTAAEVAGIPPAQVSDEQRERAKAVNFGIIYGSSAFGLANQLGIATADAQATIDAYFARYRGVRRFLDETVAEARERGYVRTLLGRRRQLPDIASRNRALRAAAERMAVNSVIQGTAADLIKKAMVALDAALEAERVPAHMILQVHDELVFEVEAALAPRLAGLVKEAMEGVLALRVPLVVEVGTGRNWREAH
jgi:DNA polymerase-1